MRHLQTVQSENDGLTAPWLALALLLSAVAIISRRPDALLNPQFWAEDGAIFFTQTYNLGFWRSVVLPFNGYLVLLQHSIAALAMHVPFSLAPMVVNFFGLACQLLPVAIMLSGRCTPWGNLPVRMLYALIYVALPNSWEVDISIADAHFHLALAAFLLLTGTEPQTLLAKTLDLFLFALEGLSGPWALILLPVWFLYRWRRWNGWFFPPALVLAVCALTQLLVLASPSAGSRPFTHLGATPMLALRMLAGPVFSSAILGQNQLGLTASRWLILAIALAGLCLLALVLLKGNTQIRLFILFSFAILAASLKTPIIVTQDSQWRALLSVEGCRYWFFPMLAVMWSVLWVGLSFDRDRTGRYAFSALLLMAFAMVRDWRYQDYVNLHFEQEAQRFAKAPAGSKVTVQINPPGWEMHLVKRSDL